MADGTVRAWGEGHSGQLGNGSVSGSATPVTVTGIGTAERVASGGYHSLALLADGSVKAWGLGASGQLGDGGTASSSVPVTVAGLDGVAGIAAGTFHSAAVTATRELWTWGGNDQGQLGTGGTTGSAAPVQVPGGAPTTVAAGYGHTLAVHLWNRLRAWGGNGAGQLGDGTTTGRTSPVRSVVLMNVWNTCHEDLGGRPELVAPLLGGPCRPGSHGTPVIGIVGATDGNATGMAGVAPSSPLRLALKAAGGVEAAFAAAQPGDVVLFEAVAFLDGGNYPIEVDTYIYDQITVATAAGVTVIEPAGNEGNDLDDPGDPNATELMGRPDSGAIVVGAGEPPSEGGANCIGSGRPAARSALVSPDWAATYGSRVDLQGYGACVATIGTPGFQNLTPAETDPDKLYRGDFSGASAAAPIVAGAAASLQGIAKRDGTPLTPAQVRQILVGTGTPQPAADAGVRPIGPLPDLKAAVTALKGGPTGAIASAFAGKCVDVDGGGTADGTPVQLWTCNGSAAQVWTMRGDGSVRALGKCLDVDASGTANGTPVQLWECNGSGAQAWSYDAATDALVNPRSGRCLDVPGSDASDGARLQIYDCNSSDAQRWTVPS